MYYFNSFLFNNLPKLFGLSDKGVSEKVYGKSYMYKRKVDNQDNILVQDIVMVCNTFHISLSNFIMSAPPENLLGNRFKYVIPDEDFKEVRFIPENLRFLSARPVRRNSPFVPFRGACIKYPPGLPP